MIKIYSNNTVTSYLTYENVLGDGHIKVIDEAKSLNSIFRFPRHFMLKVVCVLFLYE